MKITVRYTKGEVTLSDLTAMPEQSADRVFRC